MAVLEFVDNLNRFAFYSELKEKMAKDGFDIEQLLNEKNYSEILKYTLESDGLNYVNQPKGSIKFHYYPDGSRTAFEEHLQETVDYAMGKDKTTKVHFTISPEHRELANLIAERAVENHRLAGNVIAWMDAIRPLHYVLHIPFTTPTLTSEPGVYFYRHQDKEFNDWTPRALNSLKALKEKTGQGTKLLVENINYSPLFLEPLLSNELCGLCLDLGHLLLGHENVMDILKCYLDITEEVHLHGVIDHREHLSLSVLPAERVSKWVRFLWQSGYKGIVNMEVFTPTDLEESINIMSKTFSVLPKKN